MSERVGDYWMRMVREMGPVAAGHLAEKRMVDAGMIHHAVLGWCTRDEIRQAGLEVSSKRIPCTHILGKDKNLGGQVRPIARISERFMEFEHKRRYQGRAEAYRKADFDSLVETAIQDKLIPDVKQRQAGDVPF